MIHACFYENCTMVFDRPWKLRNHLALHDGIKRYTCNEPNCHKSYTSSSHLIRHSRTAHVKGTRKEVEVFVCSFAGCDATFDTMWGLQRHTVKHNNRFICTRCNISFNSEIKYEKHVQRCRNRWRECFLCRAHFVTKSDLKRHIHRAHTAEELSMFECAHCQHRFVKKYTLKRHLENVHGFDKIQIRRKSGLINQTPIVTEASFHTEASFYECAYCQIRFISKRNLKTHIQIIHKASPVFLCEKAGCCKVFLYKRNLLAHVRCDHERNLFECGYLDCGLRFKYKKSLIYHIRKHE